MEEHSGVYECVYKTSPVIKGQVNISGKVTHLLLGLRRERGSCELRNALLRCLFSFLESCL